MQKLIHSRYLDFQKVSNLTMDWFAFWWYDTQIISTLILRKNTLKIFIHQNLILSFLLKALTYKMPLWFVKDLETKSKVSFGVSFFTLLSKLMKIQSAFDRYLFTSWCSYKQVSHVLKSVEHHNFLTGD